jgi:hypothetical protein
VYSIGTIATNQICPKTKTTSPVTISLGQSITVQPGCHIQTMDLIITAEDSDNFEIITTWLDWTITLAQLFDHKDTEQLLQLVNQIRSTVSDTFDASKLLQRIDSLNKPFQSHHWLFSSPAAMIGTVCIIALISFGVYSKCCSKSPPTNTVSTLPLALPPSIAATQAAAQAAPQPVHNILPPKYTPYDKAAPAPKSITIINS